MKTYFCHHWEPGVELLLEKLRVAHGTVPPAEADGFVIVQWGASHSALSHEYVLNPVKMTRRALRRTTRHKLLRLGGQLTESDRAAGSGAGAPGSTDSGRTSAESAAAERKPAERRGMPGRSARHRYSREYIVPVFHLEALAAFEKTAGPLVAGSLPQNRAVRYRELASPVRGYHASRAVREAVRAIYALGLDFGAVYLGVRPDGRLVVRDVQPAPRLSERLAELFAEAIHRFDEQLQREPQQGAEVVLGTDPEFLLRNKDGKVVFASRYMDKAGKVGCDSIVLPDRRKLFPLAELRPDPASEPEQLVRNLRWTMRRALRIIGDSTLEWVAGGMPLSGFPLGGHIHFSGVPLNARLLRALDNYLALPLVLLEDATTGRRRPRYGFLGDFRRQSHGGFEYRTPPSWIVSPLIAAGVLSLARVVAEHYRGLRQFPLEAEEVQAFYYEGSKEELLPIVRRLWEEVEGLPAYARYKAHLDPFKERLFRMEGWHEQEDFRARWKLIPAARQPERPMEAAARGPNAR